jgi:hypothetical protein
MFYNIYHIFLNQRNGNRFPGWYYDHIYQRFQFSFFLYIYICIGMATLKWENAQRITTVFKITPA